MASVSAVPRRSAVVFDHLVVLVADELPVNRSGQDRLQVGVGLRIAGLRPVQLLIVDRLESREELEAQESREGEPNFALAVAIDVILIDGHLGAMPQDAFDHGRDFR